MNGASLEPTTEVINTGELLARCLGSVDFATRVLAKFQDRFGIELAQMEKDLSANNMDDFVLIAHRIKGATANISAPQLHQSAAKIERLGRDDRVEELELGLQELRQEWSKFTEAITTLEWTQHDAR